jgi:uncharacterized protein YjlB
VREKPEMAGVCNIQAGASYARDKPAGAFVVSGTILVGRQMDVQRPDGRSERQTDGEDQQMVSRPEPMLR